MSSALHSLWCSLRRWLWLTGLALGVSAAAHGSPVRFDVAAQPADTALAAFARQAGVEVLFSASELKKVRANAIVGLHEPEAALMVLLRGTGFTAARSSTGKFMVVREHRRMSAGEIRGLVLARADGRPVPHALIRRASATTGTGGRADGSFILRDVAEDAHALLIEAEGFTTLRIADVVVEAGRRTDLHELRLEPAVDGPQRLAELVVRASELDTHSVPVMLALQEVVVTPSRFGIDEERGTLAATLTESDLLALPQLGDDLYRAISHLPGLAADDMTARFWVRGAPHEQVLARLDGVDLIEPFHLKDTDSSLSILDIDTISRLDLYTGGFTAEFGDRLAGVLTMETDSYARAKPRTTVGLSLTGARLASRGRGANGRIRWLASARSGYPDIALQAQETGNSEIKPRYYDLMGKVEFQLTPNQVVSFHALHVGDRMFIQDSDGPQLTSRYDSDYFWARWQGQFGRVTGETVLAHTQVSWRRDGAGLIDQRFPFSVHERRQLNRWALRQDWTGSVSERALMRGGFEAKASEADYNYAGIREQQVVRGGSLQVDRVARNFLLSPDSRALSAYAAVRLQPRPELTLEPGLRYDGNTHAHDSDFSPRFNAALHRGRSTFRVAWGLHHQA